CLLHGFEGLVIRVHTRRTRPGLLQGLQGLAERQRAPLAPGEGVIIEEDLPQVREECLGPPDFGDDTRYTARAPGMATDGLRPEAESAQRRAATRGVERHERMQQEGHIIPGNIEVTLVDLGSERQGIEILILEQRPRRRMDNLAVVPKTHASDLREGLAGSEVRQWIINFFAHYKIDG